MKKDRRKEMTDHEMMDMVSKIKRYTVHQMFPTGVTITNETCGYVVEEKGTGKFLDGKAYKMIFEDKNDPLKPSLYVGNDKCEFSDSKKDDWRGVFYYFELNGNEER